MQFYKVKEFTLKARWMKKLEETVKRSERNKSSNAVIEIAVGHLVCLTFVLLTGTTQYSFQPHSVTHVAVAAKRSFLKFPNEYLPPQLPRVATWLFCNTASRVFNNCAISFLVIWFLHMFDCVINARLCFGFPCLRCSRIVSFQNRLSNKYTNNLP